MKIIFSLLLFFFSACSVSAQGYMSKSVSDEFSFKKIKGINVPLVEEVYHPEIFRGNDNSPELIQKLKIKTEDIYYYSFVNNVITDSVLRKQIFYNTDGDMIRVVIYNGSDTFSDSHISYYSPGFRHRVITGVKGGRIQTQQITEYKYDSLGLEKTIFQYNGDTSTLTIEEKYYDANERCIRVMRKYNNNEFAISKKYTYDNSGNLVVKTGTSANEDILFEYVGSPVTELNVYLKAGKDKVKQEAFHFNNKMQIAKVIKWKVRTSLHSKSLKAQHAEQVERESMTDYAYNSDGTIVQKIVNTNTVATIRRHFYRKH